MKWLIPLITAVALLSSCKKDIDNKEAVKQGVVDYLNKRQAETGLNMGMMDVNVSSVTFDKNTAKAMVSFVPKGSAASAGMTKGYVLQREGAKWVVSGAQSSGVGSDPHGGMPPPDGGGAMPPNHPPIPMPEKK